MGFNLIPVLLSGGSGKRLWPLSRQNYPKQFSQFLNKTLFEISIDRLDSYSEKPIIISVEEQGYIIKNIDKNKVRSILEPLPKNTAPAIALLCKVLELEGKEDDIVGVFSVDHYIENEEAFQRAVDLAVSEAKSDKIVTLGIVPDSPNVGYGYIELLNKEHMMAHKVSGFKEKPDLATAKEYLAKGNYFWNAGIFIFKVSTMINELIKVNSSVWQCISKLNKDHSNLDEIYREIEPVSIDYDVMEKSSNLLCVPCDIGWKDLGSWDAVAETNNLNLGGNKSLVVYGKGNNFSFSKTEKTHAFIDVDDLLVIDTPEALLVTKKGSSQKVKNVLEKVTEHNGNNPLLCPVDFRPWGYFEILSTEKNFKIKKITVLPGERLSYQSHEKRSEHWIVLEGSAELVLDDKVKKLNVSDYFYIPVKSKHRIKNVGSLPLVFIEVQMGTYFGEDDIVRYSDDYNRT